MPPRAVVTGGAGFIGSHVADRLLEFGCEGLVIDNLASGPRSNVPPAALLEECDVADGKMESLLAKLAWRSSHPLRRSGAVASSARDPSLDAPSNVVGTARTEPVQSAGASRCQRFVYVTTRGTPLSRGDSTANPCAVPLGVR